MIRWMEIFNRKFIMWVLLVSLIWLLLWFAPWQARLSPFLWLRLGMALMIFVVPGMCIYGLFQVEPESRLNYFTFGFVISHLLLALLGTLGRLLQVSFDMVKNTVMLFSLILILYQGWRWLESIRLRFTLGVILDMAAYWPLALIIVLAGLMSIQRVLSDDDLTYVAYLTNWLKAPALNFNDIFFGADKLASVRFWIVSTPFSQAFLAATSGLPGIFIVGGYYEPFLAALSICSMYGLARTLSLTPGRAMIACIFQILFLSLLAEYLHPGAPFFRQLSSDKATATFLVVPVFLQSVIWYLKNPVRNNSILVALTGLSLMMMHPVALVYAIMVAGLIILFGLSQTNLRKRVMLLVILVVVMSPQIVIRFVDHEAQGVIPYSTEAILTSGGIESLISFWPGTNFYGFNPSILAMHIPYTDKLPIHSFVLQFGWLVFPLTGGFFAIKSMRRDYLSQYVLACFLLAVFAGLPLTGWLLGYIVSAWMLERALWLYPYGIGMVFFLTALDNLTGFTKQATRWLRPLHDLTKIDPRHWLTATLTIFLAIPLVLVMREQELPNLTRLASSTERYNEFTKIGMFMDAHITGQAIAVGTDRLNDYIPSISAKVKLISFRPSDTSYPYFYSPEERNQRLWDRQAIFSRDISMEDRIALIQKYQIKFLWVRGGEYYQIKDLLLAYPGLLIEHHIDRYYLVEVREQ